MTTCSAVRPRKLLKKALSSCLADCLIIPSSLSLDSVFCTALTRLDTCDWIPFPSGDSALPATGKTAPNPADSSPDCNLEIISLASSSFGNTSPNFPNEAADLPTLANRLFPIGANLLTGAAIAATSRALAFNVCWASSGEGTKPGVREAASAIERLCSASSSWATPNLLPGDGIPPVATRARLAISADSIPLRTGPVRVSPIERRPPTTFAPKGNPCSDGSGKEASCLCASSETILDNMLAVLLMPFSMFESSVLKSGITG